MHTTQPTREQVRAANRSLYDATAEQYEQLDGRRDESLARWLTARLRRLRAQVSGGALLDIGAGGGFLTRCAEGLYDTRVGIDISPKILRAHRDAFELGAAADVDRLPFADDSFDVVTCFAVLHHLYDFERMVPEVARVLKPGGRFYTDHDMDEAFFNRFRIPLGIYRRLSDAKGKYLSAAGNLADDTYDLAEWQEDGISVESLLTACRAAGLTADVRFHWYGLTGITDRMFGTHTVPRGWAPLVSLEAVNP